MLFPIRTDRRLKRRPWVNYALIAVNVLVFLFTLSESRTAPGEMPTVARFYLWPESPELFQYLTYQFLHADWFHLLGNMLFLYVFGNSVEDRLGRVAYLFFYLAGGVIAGLGHWSMETAPVLGASGAVAGVTGAYLALFPLSNVTVIYWIIVLIGAIEVPGIVVIGIQIAMNLFFQFFGGGNVAYLAHLAGYAHGFVIGMSLLMLGLLAREPYDMLALLERRRRRSEFQRMARQGYQPWDHAGPREPTHADSAPPISAEQEALMQARSEISRAMNQHDMPGAARRYRQLLDEHPDQVMGQQQQLDLANQLMAEGLHDTAARAYELFLQHYPGYPQREQVELVLALLCARYLNRPDRARELLADAAPRLEGSNRQLADQIRAELA